MNCQCLAPGACPRHGLVSREDWANCRAGSPPVGKEKSLPCVYLGKERAAGSPDSPALYECRQYNECVLHAPNVGVPSCHCCGSHLKESDAEFPKKFRDRLTITDRFRTQTEGLCDMLAGQAAFLVGGGPSSLGLDFGRVNARGIFSMGINNAAATVPVSSFICSDPPDKFHHSIYKNAQMMKFVPLTKLKPSTRVREKVGDEFQFCDAPLQGHPNVWGYSKRGWLSPDSSFFTEPSASLGNYDEGVQRLGAQKAPLTLFAAIRVLYYLGARTIYLVGIDFKMDKDQPYSFPQKKDAGGVENNNERYPIVNESLVALRPVFELFGLTVLNTNKKSGLTAFDFINFRDAVDAATQTKTVWSYGDQQSLAGWYEK